MPILDFKEIPIPMSGPQRDQFELFAREFLDALGFQIVVGPDRGPDAGRDLVVQEVRRGIAGETRLRWLVSCKHKAHSGASVGPEDEPDIHDRVRTHECQGFLAFYSTIPSSGLAAKLNAPHLPFEVEVYDRERIEKHILSFSTSVQLGPRFFPKSFALWKANHPCPAKIFTEEPELSCSYCGTSLLSPEPQGIVVAWTTMPENGKLNNAHTEHLYWCCKGNCDVVLGAHYRQRGLTDGWEDIPDLIIPTVYIRWVMVTLNQLQGGVTFSKEAFARSKQLLVNLFPLVSRHLTAEEKDRVKHLTMIPHYLGGLGYED